MLSERKSSTVRWFHYLHLRSSEGRFKEETEPVFMFVISHHIRVEQDHNEALFSTLPFIPSHQLNLVLITFPWITERPASRAARFSNPD